MKKHLVLLLLLVHIITQAQQAFITTWDVTNTDMDIRIPTNTDDYTYNYTIDFGEGLVLTNQTDDIHYVFQTPGVHTVTITGDFPHFDGQELNDSDDSYKLKIG